MSGFFYRLLIGMGQTTLGYREALLRCEPGWKLLDIGTGDGYALLRNAELIKENKWEIGAFGLLEDGRGGERVDSVG